MPVTPIALFRLGNAHGPRMERVRPGKDIVVFDLEGETWVRAGTGGVSTSAFAGPMAGQWWRLAAGYDHGVLLLVVNDYDRHWSWEPAADMRLVDYQDALRATNAHFAEI